MPTYEYRCTDCGEHLEVVQRFTDDPLTECPACGGSLRKVFGSIGITFKGSGFYKTDSRSSSGKGRSSSGDGSKETSAKESSSKESSSKDAAKESSSSSSSSTSDAKTA